MFSSFLSHGGENSCYSVETPRPENNAGALRGKHSFHCQRKPLALGGESDLNPNSTTLAV